jgi:hypothetical protein
MEKKKQKLNLKNNKQMLKKNITLSILIALVSSCVVRQPTANQVSFVSEESAGMVKIHTTGLGNNLSEMEQDAQIKAFETILYVGLPSASTETYRSPMVENKVEMQGEPSIKKFFNNREYAQFVTRVDRLEYLKQRASKGGRVLNYNIVINYTALRRYMEQNEIIRKFGY